MATSDKLIQVKNLKKYYNKGVIHALDDVTVDVNRGDVMVVIVLFLFLLFLLRRFWVLVFRGLLLILIFRRFRGFRRRRGLIEAPPVGETQY